MNKIRLVLIVSTLCVTIQAGGFNSLKKTINDRLLCTTLAVTGLSMGGVYLLKKKLNPIQVPLLNGFGTIVGHEEEWRVIASTGSLSNPLYVWSLLGSCALGLGALGKLGYSWWNAR